MKSNWNNQGWSAWESWAHGALALAVSALMVGAFAGEIFREPVGSVQQAGVAQPPDSATASVAVARGAAVVENQTAR